MPATPAATSTAASPLELLGTHAGLSVVDPGTLLTRPWYFDGRFLRAEDFRLDQQYLRSLVALSDQAVGSGVVHGFDVGQPPGDRLRVEGGLALAPSGRVVYLPQRVELSIAELIARSTGTFDPSTPPEPGTADFRRCPPDLPPARPDLTVPPHPLYVLTVAGIEALCGEEERFGRLCEGACATETDRSTVVEGVCFRVRELTLALPTSTAVPFGDQHLRSRVATAYFERERAAVPSMISGARLRNPVWCAAAEGIGGEEVALAVLDRSGAVTSFVDGWIARRELMETTPRRYWAWRMAMRPWDVFLAQVLQFQCQLLDLGADGGGQPCAGERDALATANELLASLTPGADELSRVEAVRAKIRAVLESGKRPPSGSLLVDAGFVTVPSAGYLPTSLDRDVTDQLRVFFGPGVDLRFCAVRPDFVPEALLEAQHMERISLTRGRDDPEHLEEVDVLVPGGEVIDQPTVTTASFTGEARIPLPRRAEPGGSGEGETLRLSLVGRDSTATGWSWTLAGFGEVSTRLDMSSLIRGMFGRVDPTGEEGEGSTEPRPLADGEARPVAGWLDGQTAVGLDTLPIGGSTDVSIRASIFLPLTADTTAPVDVRVTGTLRVIDVLKAGPRTLVRTLLDGVADVFLGGNDAPSLRRIQAFPLGWTFAVLPTGTRLLDATARDPVINSASFTDRGDPRRITGEVFSHSRIGPGTTRAAGRTTIATLELEERDGALAPRSPGRALAESAISLLGTELAKAGRDPAFTAYATNRLLGGIGEETVRRIRATTDWVLFHRRRTRICAGEPVERPLRLRAYRLLHAKVGDGDVDRSDTLHAGTEPAMAAASRFHFEPVATLEFPEGTVELRTPASLLRASWQAGERGSRWRLAGWRRSGRYSPTSLTAAKPGWSTCRRSRRTSRFRGSTA